MKRGCISIIGGQVVVTPANGTVWMSKPQIAYLFNCYVAKVSSNITSILKGGVLFESEVCHRLRHNDGSCTELYNLEMITALAFRIWAPGANLFRQWIIGQALSPIVIWKIPGPGTDLMPN